MYKKVYGNKWKEIANDTIKNYKEELETLSDLYDKLTDIHGDLSKYTDSEIIEFAEGLGFKNKALFSKMKKLNKALGKADGALSAGSKILGKADIVVNTFQIGSKFITGDDYDKFGAVLDASAIVTKVPVVGQMLGFYASAFNGASAASKNFSDKTTVKLFSYQWGDKATENIKKLDCKKLPGAINFGGYNSTMNSVISELDNTKK